MAASVNAARFCCNKPAIQTLLRWYPAVWAAVNRSLTVADKLREGFPGNCKKKDVRFTNIAGCISYDSSQAGTALKKPWPLRAWPQWLAEIEKRTAYSCRKPLKASKNYCKGI